MPISNESEPLSNDYTVEIDGMAIPVYIARVSAIPFNQGWPGYQRPLDQTELAAFASWDMIGPVNVKIVSSRSMERIKIRPASAGISPVTEGREICFKLDRPQQFTVEINGHHFALHCFANPPESSVPARDESEVIYFGPGVHRPGIIRPKSGQRIYLAAGAVVHGSIQADHVQQLSIGGRGILDTSTFQRFEAGGCICLTDCRDCVIEGITLRDSDVWTLIAVNCSNVKISNVKLIGLWRYNADGIDIVNSQQVVISDCFVRAFDDCIVIKGLKAWVNCSAGLRPSQDITVERCVLWNDWGRALEIGAETVAPTMSRIIFRDCQIIHATMIAMDIQNGDRAIIDQITFENIAVELDDGIAAPQYQFEATTVFTARENSGHLPQLIVLEIAPNGYSSDAERGRISDIHFKNITVVGPKMPNSSFQGFDAEHKVERITIDGLTFNGDPIKSFADADITVRAHVQDVLFNNERRLSNL